MTDSIQDDLFDEEELEDWRRYWKGMPEFIQDDLGPWKSLVVHFECRADLEEFAALVKQKVRETTRSIWYPQAEIGRYANKRYTDES